MTHVGRQDLAILSLSGLMAIFTSGFGWAGTRIIIIIIINERHSNIIVNRLTSRLQNVSNLDIIGAKDHGGGGDNCSYTDRKPRMYYNEKLKIELEILNYIAIWS